MRRDEEGLAEAIVERAPIGLMALDEDGTIRWTNWVYADLLDVPREDLIGSPFTDLVAAGYYEEAVVERYLDVVRTLLSSTTEVDHQSYLVRTHLPDDETLVHDVSTALLPFEDGEFGGTVHAFRDVTTQKAYERELNRQNERLEEFTSVVSHDLRNPLNVAQGYLDRALETGDRDALRKVERAHDRMETLIDDLLSLAADGREVRDPMPVDVAAVARRAWESVETGDAALDAADDVPEVDADATRSQQLFENLFRNAVEHGSDDADNGDPLTVTVGALEDDPGFYVADDGRGIPPDRRSAVFDRGYTTTSDGTGFGLAIVETIADAHGWTVDVAAAAGARFEIRTAPDPL